MQFVWVRKGSEVVEWVSDKVTIPRYPVVGFVEIEIVSREQDKTGYRIKSHYWHEGGFSYFSLSNFVRERLGLPLLEDASPRKKVLKK